MFFQYVFPPDFEQSVLLRDNQCFITGTEASLTNPDLGVSWIVPPAWVYRVLASSLQRLHSLLTKQT